MRCQGRGYLIISDKRRKLLTRVIIVLASSPGLIESVIRYCFVIGEIYFGHVREEKRRDEKGNGRNERRG